MVYCVICDHEFYDDNNDKYECISCFEYICESCVNLCYYCENWICDNCCGSNHGTCEFKKCDGCGFKSCGYNFKVCTDNNCSKIYYTNVSGGNECDISNKNLIRCFKCDYSACIDHRFNLGCDMCNNLDSCICYDCIGDNNIDEIIKLNTEKCENDCWEIKDDYGLYYINIDTKYCVNCYKLYYNDKMKKIIKEINESYLKCDDICNIIEEYILF